MVRSFLIVLLALGVGVSALDAQKKKKKSKKDEEPITQVLELLPDPPAAVKVEASRLVFLTSPLSNKGLLSQQSKDALSALRRLAKGATLVKLRAFVAGRGDARRVSSIVSEQFTEWKLPLPALSILQVGALPLEGAQVQIEGIAEERKPVNPFGVAYLAAKQVVKPLGETGDINAVQPLLLESMGGLAGEVLAVTCYVSSIDGAAELERAMAQKFPSAARILLQAQRATGSGLARCEGVARRTSGNPDRLVLTGTLIGFGSEAKDVQLVAGRLEKLLEANQATLVERKGYAVSRVFEGLIGSICIIEGVGSNEATFALEAVGLQK
jgi:enamine deaminase RidA (YjgF/YER057c/UK114 family)